MNKPLNAYDTVAIGVSHNKAKVYHQVLMSTGDVMQIGTAFSTCDKVILDIKAIARARYSESEGSTKESVKYYLNEDNPFDILISSFAPAKTVRTIRGLISYNRSKNIIEVNSGIIFNRGFFSFSIKLNFSSDGVTRGKIVKQKSIIKVKPSSVAEKLFDGLKVRVEKTGSDSKDALVIDEFKRYAQNNLFKFTVTDDDFGCDKINVRYTGSGDFKFDENVNVKNVHITSSAFIKIPSGYPIVSIFDRTNAPRMEGGLKYLNSSPKLYTTISHTEYFTSNALAFYDQIVRRTLIGDLESPRDHPLISIRDIFGTIQSTQGVPLLHFRREYGVKENPDNGKAPYNFYFCPKFATASDGLAEVISVNLSRLAASYVKVDISVKERTLTSVSLESKTEFSMDGYKKFFYGQLHIKMPVGSVASRISYGKHKVFHTDVATNETMSNPVLGISVIDIVNALSLNIAGTVSSSSPNGSSSTTHAGFMPTFKELGIFSNDQDSPIVSFGKGKDFRACALMAAARLWNGNTDQSIFGAREESESSSLGGKKISSSIFCRGLAQKVDLSKYVGIAPLCRSLTTAFVRGNIKKFSEHFDAGDFKSIEDGGPGFNKFYKYDTMKKSIDVMTFGESYFKVLLNLPDEEVYNMKTGGPATSTVAHGVHRPLIGAAQIGVAFDFLGDTKEDSSGFFENTPAYMISHLGLESIEKTRSANFTKRLDDFSGGSGYISLNYKHNAMFPGPYSYGAKKYVPSPVQYGINVYGEDLKNYYNGGIFHVLYSTSGKGSHVGLVNDIRDSDNAENSLSLDPFHFDNNALLICEGGDETESPRRKIQITPCMQWLNTCKERSRLLSAFLRKGIIDWAKDKSWRPGNTIKIKFDSSMQDNYRGVVTLTGTGSKTITSFLDYDAESDVISYSSNIGDSKFIGNTISDFVNAHKSTFSGILDVDVSPALNGSAKLPYADLIFNRIVRNSLTPRPIYDIPGIAIENPDEYNPYFFNPYLVNPYEENPYASSAQQVGSYEILDNSFSQDLYSSIFDAYTVDAYTVDAYTVDAYTVDAYTTDAYVDTIAVKPLIRGPLMVYNNEVLQESRGGIDFHIDFLNLNNYPRSYYFYLNNPKYNSVQDLIDDINIRLSDLGIVAESLIENPKAYSVPRLTSKEESTVVNANYGFSRIETYPTDPGLDVDINTHEDPYVEFDISPYSSKYIFDPYAIVEEAADNQLTSEEIFDLINAGEGTESGTPQYRYYTQSSTVTDVISYLDTHFDAYTDAYSYTYIDAYTESMRFDEYSSVSFPVIPKPKPPVVILTQNPKPYSTANIVPVITFERVRTVESFDNNIDIDYDLYDTQFNQPENLSFKFVSKSTNFAIANNNSVTQGRPRDVVGVSDMPASSVISLVSYQSDESRYEESSNLEDNRTVYQYRSAAQGAATTPPTLKAIEIAYGGEISGGAFSYNNAPNTYFVNSEQTGLGDIEFRTIDADFAIILVRIAYQDGSYGPTNAAADSIINAIRATVSYNSSTDQVIIVAAPAPAQTVETMEMVDASNQTVSYLVFPAMLKIPLKSSLNYISIFYNETDLSASVKVIDAPSELDEFGFLAVNKNNPNYDMGESRDGRTFGLVLDNYGFWDILIAPEASLKTVTQGSFSFNGRGYNRITADTDDKFIAGIGTPIINSDDNDISGFDATMIPSAIRNSITLIPVPGFQQVWVLRIDPSVKSYLLAKKRAAGGKSQDGCYIDIPIYFQASITESAGTCNVRVFNDVSCVFDYTFCDFFWNLGSPLVAPAAFVIKDSIEIKFTEYLTCEPSAIIITNNGIEKIEITSYFMMEFNKIPLLDNGNALLLIKADTSESDVIDIFNPSMAVLNELRTPNGIDSFAPWEFNCSFASGIDKINKTTIYTDPQNYLTYSYLSSDIATGINTKERFLLVQPKFKFPAYDENGVSSPREKVVASIGFVFKNWIPASTDFWNERMMFGIKFVIPREQIQTNLMQNFTIRFLYNEDRRLL